jgi:hypothetical protein
MNKLQICVYINDDSLSALDSVSFGLYNTIALTCEVRVEATTLDIAELYLPT